MYGLLKRLDDAAFLGFRIWEFSFRSLRRRYALTFLHHIVLRHPANAIAGVSKYRRLVRANLEQSDITMLFEDSEDDLVESLGNGAEGFAGCCGFLPEAHRSTLPSRAPESRLCLPGRVGPERGSGVRPRSMSSVQHQDHWPTGPAGWSQHAHHDLRPGHRT